MVGIFVGFDDTVSDGVRVGVLHPDYATRQEPVDTVLVATTVRLKETEMPLFEKQSKVDKEELLLFMSDLSGKENTVVEATEEEKMCPPKAKLTVEKMCLLQPRGKKSKKNF